MRMAIALLSWALLAADTVKLSKFDFSIRLPGPDECEMSKPVAEALSRAQSSLQLSGFGLRLTKCPAEADKGVQVSLVDKRGHAADAKFQKRLPAAMLQAGFKAGSSRDLFLLH